MKDEVISVRLTTEEKLAIATAAAKQERNISWFVVRAAVSAARRINNRGKN